MYRKLTLSLIGCFIVLACSLVANAQNVSTPQDTILVEIKFDNSGTYRVERIRKWFLRIYTDKSRERYKRVKAILDTARYLINELYSTPNLSYNGFMCDFENPIQLDNDQFELFKKDKQQMDYLEYESRRNKINGQTYVVYFYSIDTKKNMYFLYRCTEELY